MFTVISHQSSVISHQSSVISHQSSVISHQSSVISHQSSVISHQVSVQIKCVTAYQFPTYFYWRMIYAITTASIDFFGQSWLIFVSGQFRSNGAI
ncbi:hypothetical protein [Nostoc sphaeroides]|uniref:hypothetical protein n=1 Tax=Nostoc sphaeroides TaxID=446679 RepID=UPI0018836BF7|nr:hypothetical protein [Nostoc sphaeroides]